MNAEQLILSSSLDDEGPGLWTANDGLGTPATPKIDHEFGGPHRQYPFSRIGNRMATPIPEKRDEIGKRFFRNVVMKDNRSQRLRSISIRTAFHNLSHIASITRWVGRKQAGNDIVCL